MKDQAKHGDLSPYFVLVFFIPNLTQRRGRYGTRIGYGTNQEFALNKINKQQWMHLY